MKMTGYDKQRLKRVWAPHVTGVPPCMQVGKDMMLLPDGEIRHYGIDLQSSGMSFCYLSSRDNGLSWKQYPVPA